MPQFTPKEKVTIKDIVLEHIKAISLKALSEFKGGYWKKELKGNFVEEVYVPDSRKEYIQGIEFLSDLLLPDFDKTMKDKNKEIKEKIKSLLKDLEDKKIGNNDYVIKKLRLMRNLFQQLMIFLKRSKFFKKKIVVG